GTAPDGGGAGHSAFGSGSAALGHPEHVGGLGEVLYRVVDDAHQAGAAGDGRVPGLVDDVAEVEGGELVEVVLQRIEGGEDVVQQRLAVLDLDRAGLFGAVAVADGGPLRAEPEALAEVAPGPHLLLAGERGELDVDLAPGVPQQPGDGVGVPAGVGGELEGPQSAAQRVGHVTGAGGEVAEQVDGVH